MGSEKGFIESKSYRSVKPVLFIASGVFPIIVKD
ncbi:hypothetical protein ABIF99_000950 [Bradyrhizobium japonicum]|nr:hypothetical protein [Bradyrhizobium japonicum]MCP1865645.1 hypothetical protein [Bradyrhizobium japonicum]MCP1895584.1 hypothetical protein [Bradyrhizobium japonicum]MCW2328967.1 hypothetical protein [Bradyrhizobium japonicum]